jgi:hypothetical protein
MPMTLRHDPGIAASPRVWHKVKVERGVARPRPTEVVLAPASTPALESSPVRPKTLFSAAYALGRDAAGKAPEVAKREAAEGARLIVSWFDVARPSEIANVAAAGRAAFLYGIWAQYVPLNAPIDEGRLEMFELSLRLPLAALLSMHRSGFLRELALQVLAASTDSRVVPFLLLRADDIVPGLRRNAEEAVAARLRPEHATAVARSLGIIELLAARVRGGGGTLVRSIRDFLAEPAQREALVLASRDEDASVRRAAFELRLRTERGERGEPVAVVLREALADEDPRIAPSMRRAFSPFH